MDENTSNDANRQSEAIAVLLECQRIREECRQTREFAQAVRLEAREVFEAIREHRLRISNT